jgi:hypothetical protein
VVSLIKGDLGKEIICIKPSRVNQHNHEVLNISKIRNGYVIFFSILLTISVFYTSSNAEESVDLHLENTNDPNKRAEELEKRLKNLEPPEPIQLKQLPWEAEVEKHYPSQTVPIFEVIDKGKKIPFDRIKNIAEYTRPVYEEHWHSTYWGGRWSYVPMRIHYALHRLFTSYDIGISGELNFKQNVGVDFPMFQNETALDLYIVVFQTAVSDVYTEGNQVVVVGNPKRNGVEVITIKTGDIHPADKKELLLVQLATPSGNEIDYSLINYELPDFWLKQTEKLEEANAR